MSEEKSKAELLEEARARDIEGRSSMNKDELAEALSSDEQESSADERLAEVEEDAPETAKLAAVTMDKHGPLILQDPSERIMTGAVSEEQAKEQEKLLKNKPEDWVGDVSEAGFDEDGNPA